MINHRSAYTGRSLTGALKDHSRLGDGRKKLWQGGGAKAAPL